MVVWFLSKLHFADEIQENPVAKPKESVKKEELALDKKLIANMTKKFDISAYKNEYKERVVKAIEDKIAGQKIQVVKSPKPKKVINLLDALKQSVEQTDNDDDEKVVSFRKRA